MQIWPPILLVLFIAALAPAGVASFGPHLLNHSLPAGGGALSHSPLMLLFCSATTSALRNKLPWPRRSHWRREDRKILVTAAIMLVLASLLTTLLSIEVMADSHRRALILELQGRRDALLGGMSGSIQARIAEVDALSKNARIKAWLKSQPVPGEANPDLGDFQSSLETLHPATYAVRNGDGQVVLGRASPIPALIGFPLRTAFDVRAELAREAQNPDFYLRVETPIRESGVLLGNMSVVLPMPAVTGLILGLQRNQPGAQIKICTQEAGRIGCLTDIPNAPISHHVRHDNDKQAPEYLSVHGQHASIVAEMAGAEHAVSFAPLGQTGLGIVTSIPASRLFAPMLHAVCMVLLLAAGIILIALSVLAWRLRPLARDLHRHRNMLQTAFDYSGIGIELVSANGRILDCNPALADMLGYAREELIAMPDIYALIPDDERERARANISQMASNVVGPYCVDRRYLHKDGSYRILRWHVSPIHDLAGKVQTIASFCVDATDSIARRRALTFQSAFLHAVLDNLQSVVYAVNDKGLLIYTNPAANRAGIPNLTGLTLAELDRFLPMYSDVQTAGPLEERPLERALHGEATLEKEFGYVDGSGGWRQVLVSGFPLRDSQGNTLGAAGFAHDVTDVRAAEQHLRWLIEHDDLTKLPNRLMAQRLITDLFHRTAADGMQPGVVLIDIDRFKHINDSYGHAFGDRLLIAVGQRLTERLGPLAFVHRHGGDEFIIAMRCSDPGDTLPELAMGVFAAFDDAFLLDQRSLFISVTAGVACAPRDGGSADELLRHADVALYRAKSLTPGRALRYDSSMGLRGSDLVEMESDLRNALDANQFVVHYQPKIHLATGVLIGAEALLRWKHPSRGLVPPDAFIPLLEETGLIVPVGQWVLQTVCEQIRDWRKQGLAAVPIAVNCSVRQLQGDLIMRQLRTALDSTCIEPGLLELEITESMMLQDPNHVSALISDILRIGIKTSIDDFGTGYSSLASLKRLPVSALKLDRTFVKDLPSDTDDAAITRAVLSMAQALGLEVIAEGVETREQADFLQALGCEAYQGWLFSPAVPPESFAQFLT